MLTVSPFLIAGLCLPDKYILQPILRVVRSIAVAAVHHRLAFATCKCVDSAFTSIACKRERNKCGEAKYWCKYMAHGAEGT